MVTEEQLKYERFTTTCLEDIPQPDYCPFCGHTFDKSAADFSRCFELTCGTKYGAFECCYCSARGPDVRSGYNRDNAWWIKAIEAWNERAAT